MSSGVFYDAFAHWASIIARLPMGFTAIAASCIFALAAPPKGGIRGIARLARRRVNIKSSLVAIHSLLSAFLLCLQAAPRLGVSWQDALRVRGS